MGKLSLDIDGIFEFIDLMNLVNEPDSPSAGYGRLYLLADELLLKKNDGSFVSIGSGSTTYSNAGEAGVSIILTKVLEDLPFKAIDGGTSGTIAVSNNATNKTVEINVVDATESQKGAVLLGNSGHSSAGRVVQANDARLTDSRTPLSHNHAGTDINSGTVAAGRLPNITSLNGYPGGSDDFLRADGTFAAPPGAGGGEANDGINMGTDGEGVFKQKTGLDLEFYNIAPASSKVTVTLDGTDNDIDIGVDESQFALAAPTYVTLTTNANLTNERILTVTSNHITLNDGGAGSAATLDVGSAILRNDQDNALGAHHYDMTRISAPSDPSANMGRFYVKQIDSNNDGVFVKIKVNGAYVERQIA